MAFTTWLRDVNPVWDVVPASVLFGERSEKSRNDDVHLTPSQKLGVLPQDEYVERTGAQVVRNRLGAGNMKHVEPGDFISHLRSFQGGFEYSALSGKVSNAYTVLSPRRKIVDRYFRYLFKSSPFVEGLGNLTDQLRDGQTVNFARFAQFGLPLPPVETQRAIAGYLDRETAEIDAMTADLEKMEKLLAERRNSIIRSRVASSSNSGWQCRKLGYLVKFRNGKETAAVENPQGRYPVYGSGGEFKRADNFLYDGPSVLFGRKGTIDKPLLVGGKFWTVDTMYYTEIGSEIYPKFLYYWATTVPFQLLSTDTALPSMTSGELSQLHVNYPDLPIQRRIVEEIDRETAEIDAMLADITELRDLLAERRAAVIAAAVTGQIDIPAAEETTHA